MYTALVGFCVNLLGNWLLLTGRWGLPALGAVGCGVATSSANWLMLGMMTLHVRRHARYRAFAPLAAFEWPDAARLREILRLGLPISIGVLAEGGLFACAGLVMGGFGASVIAAHAIAINYASLMFMVPLAVNSATAIHVGHRAGAGDMQGARFAGWTGAGVCVLFMTVSATVLVLARVRIATLYSADPGVVQIAATLLLFAAVFQVADGLQVGVTGALRGFKDAQVPMWLCILSYWAFGFPLAYVAGIVLGGGPVAVWMGLIAGLFAAALTLTLRYRWVSTQAVRAGVRAATGVLGSEIQ
jgi:MATE family multidrug resistance protein